MPQTLLSHSAFASHPRHAKSTWSQTAASAPAQSLLTRQATHVSPSPQKARLGSAAAQSASPASPGVQLKLTQVLLSSQTWPASQWAPSVHWTHSPRAPTETSLQMGVADAGSQGSTRLQAPGSGGTMQLF